MDQLLKRVESFQEAALRSDVSTIAGFYTDNALLLSNRAEIVRGRQKIAELLKDAVDVGLRFKDFETVEIEMSGEFGYEVKTYSYAYQQTGHETEWRRAKYVHIWKKQGDHTWKLHLDIWNESKPPER